MPKEFYTERDIEDLFQRGIKSLQVTENVVLTELAYEKANQLGLQLITSDVDNPPAAPVRPYLSESGAVRSQPILGPKSSAVYQSEHSSTAPPDGSLRSARSGEDIEKRIYNAVIARLGNQVDTKLLDNIIHRVVKGIGLK